MQNLVKLHTQKHIVILLFVYNFVSFTYYRTIFRYIISYLQNMDEIFFPLTNDLLWLLVFIMLSEVIFLAILPNQ